MRLRLRAPNVRKYRLLLVAAVGVAVLGAFGEAQETDATRYAVTYVEVGPASAARAVEAFRVYRDSSAREPGFVAGQLLEQVGRAGRFVILETWRDQASFDAHQAAAAATQFRSALAPIRLGIYDQRPYKTLTAASAPARASKDGVLVVAHVDIGGGASVDVPAAFRRLADATRKEAGNLRFEVWQHTVRGNHFTVLEAWENPAALDRHAAAAHTRQYREEVQPATGSPIDERLFRMVE
jgi:quinol monooxygenase YgiN